MHACMYLCIYVSMYLCACMCVYTYPYIHTHTHTHTYTHTHEMAGTEEGKQLIYPRMGNEAEGFDAPGDLILIVSLLPHFLFRREGHDLLYTGVPFYNDDVT